MNVRCRRSAICAHKRAVAVSVVHSSDSCSGRVVPDGAGDGAVTGLLAYLPLCFKKSPGLYGCFLLQQLRYLKSID